MELRLIQYFLTVAEEGNITKAAERLHITQPPLSRQLKQLEDELGTQLMVRSSQGIVLTPAGILFQQRGQQILELSNKTTREVATANNGQFYQISIGTIESIGMSMVPGWISSYAKEYPKVKFKVFSGNTYELCYQLSLGAIDVAMVRGPISTEKYNVYKMSDESWMALINKSNPLSEIEGDTLDSAMLNDQRVIVPSRNAIENRMRAEFTNISIDVNIVCTYNNASIGVAMAASDVGITLIPASMRRLAELFPNLVIKKIINPEMTSYSAIITEKDRYVPEYVESFIEMIKAQDE